MLADGIEPLHVAAICSTRSSLAWTGSASSPTSSGNLPLNEPTRTSPRIRLESLMMNVPVLLLALALALNLAAFIGLVTMSFISRRASMVVQERTQNNGRRSHVSRQPDFNEYLQSSVCGPSLSPGELTL